MCQYPERYLEQRGQPDIKQYDQVYIGHWQDGTPKSKGSAKVKRTKAFANDGTKREKGVAARQKTDSNIVLQGPDGQPPGESQVRETGTVSHTQSTRYG